MPTHNQDIVQTREVSSRDLGKRDDATLQAAFAGSPIHDETFTDENRKEDFQHRINNVINDHGHTFHTFDPNYTDAPDKKETEIGAAGLPASPYSPNVTSPGPGSTSPEDMPSAPDGYNSTPSDTPFIGDGALTNPKVTSGRQSKHTLKEYRLGHSIGS